MSEWVGGWETTSRVEACCFESGLARPQICRFLGRVGPALLILMHGTCASHVSETTD